MLFKSHSSFGRTSCRSSDGRGLLAPSAYWRSVYSSLPLTAQTPQPAGPSLQVNTLSESSPRRVQVAWRCEADVTLVVWEDTNSAGPDDDDRSIQGRFFSGLTPTGPQFQVNQAVDGDQHRPQIQVLDSGEFLVLWLTIHADDTRTVHSRAFDRTTLAPGPEQTFGQTLPRIDNFDAAADGRVAIAWWEGQFIHGQIYDPVGQPIGTPLSVELTGDRERHRLRQRDPWK